MCNSTTGVGGGGVRSVVIRDVSHHYMTCVQVEW